jgi:hypothetical protein
MVIPGAEIRLMLREPVTKKTGDDGTAVFVVSAKYAKQALLVNAVAYGYSARSSIKVRADDSAHTLLPLTKLKPEAVTEESIKNYLYISRTKVEMLFKVKCHAWQQRQMEYTVRSE